MKQIEILDKDNPSKTKMHFLCDDFIYYGRTTIQITLCDF